MLDPAASPSLDMENYLAKARKAVDQCLDRLLPDESLEPCTIHRAMRYSTMAAGKRVRPILVLATGESIGGEREMLLPVGAAIEMMHSYSLIHDDLPALDNDDMRRGRPTCHKVFGEAIAILAGDALMTRCYQVLADLPGIPEQTRLAIVREIARATGTRDGMIGGQVVDLESERKQISSATLDYIHRSKTGALLAASVRSGALAAGAGVQELQALTSYGEKIGLAFQVIDDILDVTASSQELGKTPGKDEKARKATYPAFYGIDSSRARARDLIHSAIADVKSLGERAEPVRKLAEFILNRTA